LRLITEPLKRLGRVETDAFSGEQDSQIGTGARHSKQRRFVFQYFFEFRRVRLARYRRTQKPGLRNCAKATGNNVKTSSKLASAGDSLLFDGGLTFCSHRETASSSGSRAMPKTLGIGRWGLTVLIAGDIGGTKTLGARWT
jgi:hypothetical protein